MNARPFVSALLLGGALSLGGCLGISAAEAPPRHLGYPSYKSDEVAKLLETPENQDDPSVSLGRFKIRQSACEGVDTHPETATLAEDDFSRFLNAQGIGVPDVKAHGSLFWFDFPGDSDKEVVRLRLAVLGDPQEASDELHKSLLEHGPGWWGLRRSNLSILAPKAGITEAIAFALKYKLICWGMFAMADADDVYVVPGPYMEM